MPNNSPTKSSTQRRSDVLLVPNAVYAQSLCIPDESSNTHKQLCETLIELLSGQGLSRNFERLSGQGGVYSHKVNQKIRLLYVQVPWQGGKAWCVVENMLDHKYETSDFLRLSGKERAAKIQQYLANCKPYRWDPEDGKLLEESLTPSLEATSLVQHAGRYIRLTQKQDDALSDLSKTKAKVTIVSGQPGSGKSTLLMGQLSELASIIATDESETTHILCTVPSLPLKQALSQEWQSQPDAKLIPRDPVKIFTEAELLKFLVPQLRALSVQSHDAFIRWAQVNHIEASEFEAVDLMQLYQELCALNGLRVKALYQPEKSVLDLYAMEAFQSAFLCLPSSKQRRQFGSTLLNILGQYDVYLRTQQYFDPRLFCPGQPITPKGQFYTFADETQNIAPSILFILLKLSSLKTTLFMNDSQGMAFRARLNEILILNDPSLVGDAFKNIIIRLSGSHRCPKKVVEVAQRIEALKERVNPDGKRAATSDQLQACNLSEGERFWGSIQDLPKLEQVLQSGNAAMLILGQGLASEEIQALTLSYPKTPVFLKDNFPEGLEYQDVIIIEPLGDEDQKLSRALASPVKSPLSPNEIDYYRQRLSRVMAAVTRATDRVIILQQTKQVLVPLLTRITDNGMFVPLEGLDTLPANALSEDELFERACELHRLGQHDIARNLIQTVDAELQARFHQEMTPPRVEATKSPEMTPPRVEAMKSPEAQVSTETKIRIPSKSSEPTQTKKPAPLSPLALEQKASSPAQTPPKSSGINEKEIRLQRQLLTYFNDGNSLRLLLKNTKNVTEIEYLFTTPMTCIGRRESFLEVVFSVIETRIEQSALKLIMAELTHLQTRFRPILDQLHRELDYRNIVFEPSHIKSLRSLLSSLSGETTLLVGQLIEKLLSIRSNPILLSELEPIEVGRLHYYLTRQLNLLDRLIEQCRFVIKTSSFPVYFTHQEIVLMREMIRGLDNFKDPLPPGENIQNTMISSFHTWMSHIVKPNMKLFQDMIKAAQDINPKSIVQIVSFAMVAQSNETSLKIINEAMCLGMFSSEEGIMLLGDLFSLMSVYFERGLVTRENLSARDSNGPSITYRLFSTHSGRQLLLQHWEHFFRHLTQESMNQPICDEGPSPASYLFTTTSGLALLDLYGSEIRTLFTPEELSRQWQFGRNLISIQSLISGSPLYIPFLKKCRREYYERFDDFTHAMEGMTPHASRGDSLTIQPRRALQIIETASPSPEEMQIYLKALFSDPSRQNMQRLVAKGVDVVYSYLFETKMNWITVIDKQPQSFMNLILFHAYRPFSMLDDHEWQLLIRYIQNPKLEPLFELEANETSLFSKAQLELLKKIFLRCNEGKLSKKMGVAISIMGIKNVDRDSVNFSIEEKQLIDSVIHSLMDIKRLTSDQSVEYWNIRFTDNTMSNVAEHLFSIFTDPKLSHICTKFKQKDNCVRLEKEYPDNILINLYMANPELFFEIFRRAFINSEEYECALVPLIYRLELNKSLNLPNFFPDILYQYFRPNIIKFFLFAIQPERILGFVARHITAEGFKSSLSESEKGLSALYYLCSSDGIPVFERYWDILSPFLTKDGLNQVVESGTEAGRSAVFQLFQNINAYPLLEEHWSTFKTLLTAEGMQRCVMIDGHEISAQTCLSLSPEGLAFYEKHRSDLDPILGEGSTPQIPVEVKHHDTPLLPKKHDEEMPLDPNCRVSQ